MKPFVLALAMLNFVDSISFMIVAPSLAFYINSLGGSQDIYGDLFIHEFLWKACAWTVEVGLLMV